VLLFGAPLFVLAASGADRGPSVVLVAAALACLPLVTPLLLNLTGRRWDPLLLSPAWVLCALSLVVVARVQPDILVTQMVWVSFGWAAFITVVGFPPLLVWLQRFRTPLLLAAVALVLSTFFLGEDIAGQGARLWLRVGPISVQPAEALRVGLIIFLASYFAQRRNVLSATWRKYGPLDIPPPAAWLPLVGMVGLSLIVVVAQRDFGPSLIFLLSFVGMLYLATGRRDYVAAALLLFVVGGTAAYLGSARIQERVSIWLDPWADPLGLGYQSLQAIGGFVFGRVGGSGAGYGYPGLIPAAHTDYPLAVIGEEWGLVGSLGIVLLYGLLVARGLIRAQFTESRFQQLLGAGFALSLGVQTLVVFGGVLRLLPLTGITSPFLSYGGSSMLMGWVMLALLSRAGGPPDPAMPSSDAPLIARMRLVGVALLAGFVVLAAGLGYWHVARADLLNDPAVAGARMKLEAIRVERGRLLDRNGNTLAETVLRANGEVQRAYSDPSAVHILGFYSPQFGAGGVEAARADTLMGHRSPSPLDTWRDLLHEPREGSDVHLTIDAGLQRAAAEAMGGALGAVVAIDPRTGDILAMVSNPTFDPDFGEEEWEALRTDPDSPLLNRALQGLYTPGSTFKTVTLAAALEDGVIQADEAATCDEEMFVEGVRIISRNEPPGKRTEDVSDAYAYSCNTYFAQLGLDLGAGRLRAMADALGLTEAVPFDLPTSAGSLATAQAFLDTDPGLAASAFGQGQIQVTPLHLAMIAATVANDGVVMKPRLFLDDQPTEWRRAMSVETARQVKAMMVQGVEDGWAATAAIPGVSVAAKTGSAEVAESESSHALFIAFAPADDPTIAVAVVKERAGSGSQQAGPVARAVIAAWLASR